MTLGAFCPRCGLPATVEVTLTVRGRDPGVVRWNAPTKLRDFCAACVRELFDRWKRS